MVPQGPTPSNVPLPQSVALVCGRARATAAATVAEALRELLQHEVHSWPEHGCVATKERTVRTVLCTNLAGVPVHLKVFRADTIADRARDTLRGPRGEAERDNLLRARALGLPTVEPLASGIAVDGDQLRSFVATRTVVDAAPFSFLAAAAVHARVGALLRHMHDRGLRPGDLHPGNLLVDGEGQPWLLDLTSVRHGGDADLGQRAAALAFFCQELDGGALDAQAATLLAAYLDAGPRLPDLTEPLRLATHRWRAQALPAFGRRSSRNCRHTEVPERRRGQPRWSWHLPNAGSDSRLRPRCEELAEAAIAPTKTGRRGSVWLHEDLVQKQREPGAARRLWRAGYWLLFAKVATAGPVALCLHRGRGLVFARRLGLVSLASELAEGQLDAAAVRSAARSLGTNVGRLHAHGLGNRDLKFDNLVRDPQSDEVCMVDLDGVTRGSATDTRGRGRDLGRLLAAFRAAQSPGGAASVRTFLRSYLRAHARLLQTPPMRRILRRAEQRAGEWAEAHR